MKIWLPSVCSNSGSDAYVERLEALLAEAGHQPVVTWYPLRYELCPWRLKSMGLPSGTDLIHANSWNAFAFSRHGCPLVTTVHHCIRGIGYPGWKSPAQMLYHEYWVSMFEKKSFGVSAAVVAVSASTAVDIELGFGIRSEVIENWLDTDIYKPTASERTGAPKVLFVGNLSRRKGGDLLVPFRRALDPAIELHVVNGRREKGGKFLESLPGTTVWSGLSQAALIRLYQESDVIVCLSRHEGFGYVALEAMACGKPVVAFDVSGVRDVVVPGTTGLLRTCGDVIQVASDCAYLIEDMKTLSMMGQAARQRVLERFSLGRALAKYEGLYRDVMLRSKGLK